MHLAVVITTSIERFNGNKNCCNAGLFGKLIGILRLSDEREIRMTTESTPNTINEVGETTHFGYKQVATEQKASMVANVFDSVAAKYDVMNDLM